MSDFGTVRMLKARVFESGNDAIILLGEHAKHVKLTLIEKIGRAVLNGAAEDEIDKIRREHTSHQVR